MPFKKGVTNVDESDNIRDYLLSLDDLGKPKVIDMSKIINGVYTPAILCILRLIIMRKGTDPDRPDLGIDIVGRYRFSYESELTTLQNEITEQIERYLPELTPTTIEVSMQDNDTYLHIIQIAITTKGTTYNLLYDKDTNAFEL